MLPSNVMSFMKKMVAQEEIVQQSDNSGGAFGKLKQTLSSSLLTAQDRVNKMSPRPSLIPDTGENQQIQSSHAEPSEKENETSTAQTLDKNEQNKSTANRAASCRVCLKSFKAEDFSKTCFECKYRVCEDCASYSKIDSSEDLNTWRCSVCRRKMSSRVCIPQDSTDSNLDVPVLEALQRRHSDVKLNATNDQIGLIPPRSPDLRRHSDVSPASLKELEKFSSKSSNNNNNNNDHEWDAIRNIVPGRIEIEPPTRLNSRRQSRVSRQHSYDDEIQKNALSNSLITVEDLNLPIQGQIPRRKSAYDVFGGVQPNQQLILQTSDLDKQQAGSRRSSFRIPHDDDKEQDDSPNSDNGPTLLIDDDRRTRRRGSQLPDISALRERGILGTNPQGAGATLSVNPINPYQGPSLEELEAPKKQTSLDGEAIKIVIHDCDSGPVCSSKKRIVLRRDPTDKAHRTRGFGMRVVGGKTGADGRLFAYIVWTVPGGEAEKGGLRQGDKILEWCGISLVDRSFEEVCAIMDRTGDIAELLVEHASDFRMCDLLEDNIGQQQQQQPQQQQPSVIVPSVITPTQRKNSELVGLVAEPENNEKSPASPTRRKLPKTPEQVLKERQVQGRIQVQVWYHDDRNELVVNLLAADDLSLRDEAFGFGKLPEAYAKVKIVSKNGESNLSQTEVCMPNHCPIWNATLVFEISNGNTLIDSTIEISLWDLIPQNDPLFLGECSVDLKDALINDRATWYRLEDPKNLRAVSLSKCQYFNPSPRNSFSSFATGDVSRFIRRNDYSVQRSSSQSDCDSIGEGTSLLHPDHAWFGMSSRRGSSQSETLEIETYQLNKDFSKSLPGSRRSSFQDQEKRMMEGMITPPSNINRRRSSCVRKDPDEILKSLKAVRGELGRTMSLCRETEYNNRMSRRGSKINYDNDYENWRNSQSNLKAQQNQTALSLGPGQRKPKNFILNSPKYGELFVEFHTTKSCLEIKILGTRNLSFNYTDSPDTFIECFIKDNNDRIRQKRKSEIVRNNMIPAYNTIVQYAMSDIYRRSITFIIWQCNIAECERNIGLGAIEIYFGNYKFDQIYSGWYPLFPLYSLGLADLLSP
ncbi:hypothetical protein PVAND_011430 [Polypedilum vanderplanki]|uniref:Uncharacterized protein n=1 Tax=Polypedilum vanderplanki TaxID=319348 RepID=A0A9J6CJJ2_POLVA|nr:hypothetical protein PVAND_011430 [Polypedilum vanderplanki]